MNSLERLLGRIFAGWLPALPLSVKEWAARILPWVIVVLGVLGLLAWVSAHGLFGAAAAKTLGTSRPFPAFAAALFNTLVPVLHVLTIAAGCYLLRWRRLGWRLALYALLLGLGINLVWFSPAGIAWDIVFAYLLFQLKPYYRLG